MNYETNDCHANAGVGHIKGGKRVCVGKVEIEEEEIDDVAVDQTVSEISKDARQ